MREPLSTQFLPLVSMGTPPTSGDIRNYVDTLEADGYISSDEARTRFYFRMNLLREWWLRFVVL